MVILCRKELNDSLGLGRLVSQLKALYKGLSIVFYLRYDNFIKLPVLQSALKEI